MARRQVTDFQFARAFGDSLSKFLIQKRIQNQAAELLGVGRAKLNTYCHDSPSGARRKPDAEFLYQVCVRLGFRFDYNGFTIGASSFDGHEAMQITPSARQLGFEFERQFNLTDETGTLNISFKRPAGRVEMTVCLKAVS